VAPGFGELLAQRLEHLPQLVVDHPPVASLGPLIVSTYSSGRRRLRRIYRAARNRF
jgi:hypothetical protein